MARLETPANLEWIPATDAAKLPNGTRVYTEPYGNWPGGWSRIVEHEQDPAAPEIVMSVEHETALDDGRPWQIGVFEHEDLGLEAVRP